MCPLEHTKYSQSSASDILAGGFSPPPPVHRYTKAPVGDTAGLTWDPHFIWESKADPVGRGETELFHLKFLKEAMCLHDDKGPDTHGGIL